MNTLRLEHVTISLNVNGQTLIKDVSLSVMPGEIATIMGASGSGKSTLLAFISGQLDPAFVARGQIFCGARDLTSLPPEKRRMGILFQDDMLFPHLSVGANLAFGLSPTIKGKAERKTRVDEALAAAGLVGFAKRDPVTLSGGQRTRAALMRTLLSKPDALLLDEPFSKLDKDLRTDMRAFVFNHARQQNLPDLMVSHDEADAEAAGGEIIRL